jgi:hypothetical protein
MSNPFTRRVLVVLAILALVAISTAAIAHGHLDVNSADESHCPLCMAVHTAKHAVAAPIITLGFKTVQTAILVPSKSSAIVFIQPLLTQDRAPPQL